MADKLKFLLALVLVAAGVAGFYLLSEQMMIVRVLLVLVGLCAGVAVAWFTVPGQSFFVFGRESWAEALKVSWPTNKETIQTTGVVFAFVVVMALVLWMTDKSLEWIVYDLILGWRKS